MDEIIDLYQNNLNDCFSKIDSNKETSSFEKANLKTLECELVISSLKANILNHTFKTQDDEIKFFKLHKPKIYGQLFFYKMVKMFESHKPNGSEKTIRNYIINELDNLKRYYDINNEFYTYYRNNSTHLDSLYFIRENYDTSLVNNFHSYDADKLFCTSHDYNVARIISVDYFQIFLDKKLLELDTIIIPSEPTNLERKLQWTESKTGLTELIYAFHSKGVFNHGNADLKQIASFLSKSFNIDLGDFYHIFKEIKERKKGQTKFLDELKNSVITKIECISDN